MKRKQNLDDFSPLQMSRRAFLSKSGTGVGLAALSALLPGCSNNLMVPASSRSTGVLSQPHHIPRARRVIYLFQSGGPAQMELFDYKPLLREREGEDLPESIRNGQRPDRDDR